MINAGPLWVCDTCVLIDILTDDPLYRSALASLKSKRANGEITMAVSEITVAECCKIYQKHQKDPIDVFNLVERYLAGPHIRRLPVTAAVSAKAAALIRLYRLGTCDAVIVATALAHNAEGIITRDSASLCKPLKSRTPPAALPKHNDVVGTWPDETEVVDEIKALNVQVISAPTVVPTVTQVGGSAATTASQPNS